MSGRKFINWFVKLHRSHPLPALGERKKSIVRTLKISKIDWFADFIPFFPFPPPVPGTGFYKPLLMSRLILMTEHWAVGLSARDEDRVWLERSMSCDRDAGCPASEEDTWDGIVLGCKRYLPVPQPWMFCVPWAWISPDPAKAFWHWLLCESPPKISELLGLQGRGSASEFYRLRKRLENASGLLEVSKGSRYQRQTGMQNGLWMSILPLCPFSRLVWEKERLSPNGDLETSLVTNPGQCHLSPKELFSSCWNFW